MQMSRERGVLVKRWSEKEEVIPYQVIQPSAPTEDPRFLVTAKLPADEFPINTFAIFLGHAAFGSVARVLSHQPGNKVKVEVDEAVPDTNVGYRIFNEFKENYFALNVVAKKLGISNKTLSKITASVKFNPGSLNLGLNLKFSSRGQQVMGYTRRIERVSPNGQTVSRWEYSQKAIDLLRDYKEKFPEVFRVVEADPEQEVYPVSSLFSENVNNNFNMNNLAAALPAKQEDEDEDEIVVYSGAADTGSKY